MRLFARPTLPLALLLAVACGDSTGPGVLDQAEKTALANALTASGALAGSPVAAFAGLVINALEQSGSMGGGDVTYEAIGLVIDFDIGGALPILGSAAFAFGWNDLKTSGNPPVSELVSAGLINLGTLDIPTGTRSIQGSTMTALARGTYFNGNTAAQYLSSTGSVTMSSVAFAGTPANCPGVESQPTVTCTFTVGTISGQFAFEAANVADAGDVKSVPLASFTDLPAIRVTLTVGGS